MKIKPLQDRVVLERLSGEEVSKGGIIIPDTAKERPAEGKVLAVGPGKRGDGGKIVKPEVKKGDRVLFSRYAGTEIKLDGQERMILREDEILAIIEG